MATSEFSTGKTIAVLGIVIGCFAVLWPKVFYPMFQASLTPHSFSSAQVSKSCNHILLNHQGDQFILKLCANALDKGSDMEERLQFLDRKDFLSRDMLDLCQEKLLSICGVNITQITMKHKDGKGSKKLKLEFFKNLSLCLQEKIPVSPRQPEKKKILGNHLRPERPPHLRPDILHPALRERGQAIPPNMRDPDRPPRGSPVPGRPIMGTSPHMNSQHKGSGSMGIIMPIYTIGIVIFFVYTIMKVLFKKEPDKTPKVLDFHMDPEHRKFILSEEYNNTDPISLRDTMKKQERSLRKRSPMKNGNQLEDAEIDHLKQRLAETEAAMERIMQHMGTVSDQLTSSQSQAMIQDLMLKEKKEDVEEGESSENPYESMESSSDIEKVDDGKRHIQFSPTPEYMESKDVVPEGEEEETPNFVLDTNLPSDLHVLVSEAHCEAVAQSDNESKTDDDEIPVAEPGVIISGKMTLSLIGGGEEATTDDTQVEEEKADDKQNVSEYPEDEKVAALKHPNEE